MSMLWRTVPFVLTLAAAACTERAVGYVAEALTDGGTSTDSGATVTHPSPDGGHDSGEPSQSSPGASDVGVVCGDTRCMAPQVCCPRVPGSWQCTAASSCVSPIHCDGPEDCADGEICLGYIRGFDVPLITNETDRTWTRCWPIDHGYHANMLICHDDTACDFGKCELAPTPTGTTPLGHCD